MKSIPELGKAVEELRSEITALSEIPELDDAQEARWAAANAEFDTALAEYNKAEERAARVEAVRKVAVSTESTRESGQFHAPNVIVKKDAFDVLEQRGSMSAGEYRKALVDSNLRAIEGNVEGTENQKHVEKLFKRHGSDTRWAENMLKRSRPEYESGFVKMVAGQGFSLTDEERTALSTLTNANGKFAVPTHLDGSVILANAGSSNVVRGLARVVTLTEGQTWNGLSSTGVTASFDAQLTEVSDDSPVFLQPSISVHKAQALVQFSLEAETDIPGLAGELMKMFADAKERLEGAAHCTGTGTNEPWGIFTAIDQTAGSELATATAATIAVADIDASYLGLPVRYRPGAKFLMNPKWALAIKALGTAVSASYTTDLASRPVPTIYDKEVVQSDDAPAISTTTALDNRWLFGSFDNYVIVDKPGSMNVELVPHMLNTTTNLPDGRRALYATWRTGADSVNDDAFRLTQDKTSA